MQRLILFDIDETMISSAGSGRRALERAMLELFRRPISFDGYSLSGKTDPQICTDVLKAHGYEVEEISQTLPQLFDVYIPMLEDEVKQAAGGLIHEGVEILLEQLRSHKDAYLGVLTGNIERGARIKLAHFGLHHYFSFGAYGCDSANRMELPAVAHKRAHEKFPLKFDVEDIVIIGDAQNDVLCARGYGAKSVAVCTGKTPKQALEELQPTYLFDSLANTDQVMEAIFAS
jgi:phosphoglycolate phosphatase